MHKSTDPLYILHVYDDGDIQVVKHKEVPINNSDLFFSNPDDLFKEIESYGQVIDTVTRQQILNAPFYKEILVS